MAEDVLPGIRVGVVRATTYGMFGPPERFVPQARALGAGTAEEYVARPDDAAPRRGRAGRPDPGSGGPTAHHC
ncbi:hypothetical protein [Saccharothrix obliqua]|uniref:hypothetical protein n=1 Tax=Saccharothrix obliqua TaxID=2861747 RepID=UPI001C601A73|nr:hypothetical protein [Saccharothrix obliqua]MBW4721532.1 hypothetical protein [Saccharothrix obliqua]